MPATDNPFLFIPGNKLTAPQREAMEKMRISFYSLWQDVVATIPPGRCRAIVQTHLEEACMWTIKGITHRNKEDC